MVNLAVISKPSQIHSVVHFVLTEIISDHDTVLQVVRVDADDPSLENACIATEVPV
jgi:hypothetical protein